MEKKILVLCLFLNVIIGCTKDEKQNLDISVNGKVTTENNVGMGNVTIYVERGTTGNFAATVYENYQTITTNENGNYSYVVKNDNYNYKICCGAPTGFTIVGESCVRVDQSIINSRTVPNIINFKLKQ